MRAEYCDQRVCLLVSLCACRVMLGCPSVRPFVCPVYTAAGRLIHNCRRSQSASAALRHDATRGRSSGACSYRSIFATGSAAGARPAAKLQLLMRSGSCDSYGSKGGLLYRRDRRTDGQTDTRALHDKHTMTQTDKHAGHNTLLS